MLDNQPQELGVVTSWLQSFCFFEALKVPGVIVAPEDFICVTESGRRLITTSRLPNCLWLWPVRVRNQARHVKERQGNEIVPLLVVVYKFVMENFRQLSKLNSPETLRVDLFQDLIYRIMLSIVILGKALTQFFTAHYSIQFPTMLVPQRSNVAGWLVSIRDHSAVNSHSGCGASRALVENPLLELVSPPLDIPGGRPKQKPTFLILGQDIALRRRDLAQALFPAVKTEGEAEFMSRTCRVQP